MLALTAGEDNTGEGKKIAHGYGVDENASTSGGDQEGGIQPRVSKKEGRIDANLFDKEM